MAVRLVSRRPLKPFQTRGLDGLDLRHNQLQSLRIPPGDDPISGGPQNLVGREPVALLALIDGSVGRHDGRAAARTGR